MPQVEVLKRVELRCEVSGQPEPTTTWFRNNEVLEEKEDNLNLMVNTSMLIIRSMLLADVGNYTCLKTNRGASVVGHVQLSIVEGKKVITRANIVNNKDKKIFPHHTINPGKVTKYKKINFIQTKK